MVIDILFYFGSCYGCFWLGGKCKGSFKEAVAYVKSKIPGLNA